MERRRNPLGEFIGIQTLLIPIAFSLLAERFSTTVKREVRKEQKGRCACCGGRPHKLEIHHRVPQHLGGADVRQNAVGLCGEDLNDCHERFDQLALRKGVIYPDLPIEMAPKTLFKFK